MFVVVAVGAVLLLAFLARSPSTGQNGTVPPNQLLPPTGASPIQSPATTGANPLTSSIGKGIASVTSRLPGIVAGVRPAFVRPPAASTDFAGTKELPTVSPGPVVRTVNGVFPGVRKF